VHRGPVAEISLSAVAHNFHAVKTIIQDRPVIAVVKADAYGHGAIEVSKRLLKEGASYLAVAFTGEAVALRNAGVRSPIIVLFDKGDVRDFFDLQLIPVIYDIDTAHALSQEAIKRKTAVKVHVKIDTGMGRLGLHGRRIMSDLTKLTEMPGVVIEGLLSHFSEADLMDRSYANRQLEKFHGIRKILEKKLKRKILSHISNSAAVISYKDAWLDAFRPGIMLYGYNPIGNAESGVHSAELHSETRDPEYSIVNLIPVMSVKAKILTIRNLPAGASVSYGRTFITRRKSKIGVITAGYADGYNRLFSNNADVLVRGKRVPVAGRVCMDLTMIDVTDVKGVREEDEVVIIGTQGKETINALELAKRSNTIPYEILTSLGSRAQRVYV
jgi:alanine racemase